MILSLTCACSRAQLLFVARIFVTVLLSTSIYISRAKCPMVRGEPIRWQIRCQLGGSCLETIPASLPPQFKFQTLQRRRGGPEAQPPSEEKPASGALPSDAGGQRIEDDPDRPDPKGRLFPWTR